MWYIHTMEYCAAITSNEVLTHATMWIELRNIILSGKKKRHKRSHMIPFA